MSNTLPGYKPNHDKTVAVATDYFWIPITEHTPRGQKMQLLTKGGVAIYGHWDGKNPFFTHWAPLPKRPKEQDHDASTIHPDDIET